MRLAAIVLIVMLPATARADRGVPHEMLGQMDLGLTWDTAGDRLAGGELNVAGDWRGIGFHVRADYQLQQQVVVEQEVDIVTEHGSGALGFGLQLSPVRMFDVKLGRIVDAWAEAGLRGGVTGKAGGQAMRGEGYVGLGGAVRFPIPGLRWMPALAVRWQHRTADPEFVFDDALTVAVGFAQTSADRPRD